MRGVNDRNFLHIWHIVEQATCPGRAQDRWLVGDVDWRKEHLSFSSSNYSVSLEVHHLHRSARGDAGWRLMVTIEYWWGHGRELLKSSTWARVAQGSPKAVIAWLKSQEQSLSSTVPRPSGSTHRAFPIPQSKL